MKKDKLCEKIAAQKKRVEEYETAVKQLESFRALRASWAKLIKRGKLQPVSYYRSLSFFLPKDQPVDMSEIWNWMVKYDRKECKAFHAAVSSMLDETVKSWADKVGKLCR